MYKFLVKKEGLIHFKTDNAELFNYTLETLEKRNDITNLVYTQDLYHNTLYESASLKIKTRYEQKFNAQGHDINYLHFNFKWFSFALTN